MVCLSQRDIILLQMTHGFRKIWRFRENTDCVVFTRIFSANEGRRKWAFVSRLVKAKAMQDEPSEIMKTSMH